jgi:single-strand DNA-binding protein
MSMSTLTVTGFVGSAVRYSPGENGGVPYASFRLGCTRRIYDRATQAFRDGPTQWYTVKAWRQVATHVAHSLHKGEPVVVTGRLSTDEWAGPDGPRTSLVIEATALGHDLVFGSTFFARTTSPAHAASEGEEPPVDVTALPEATGPEGLPEATVLEEEFEDDEPDEDLEELDQAEPALVPVG